jgi:mono/diheme cytochrome c family protein
MKFWTVAALGLIVIASATLGAGQAPTASAPAAAVRPLRASAPATATPDPAFLSKYCVTCHNPRAKTGGLSLDAEGLAHVGAEVEVWEKVVRKLRTGMMPPIGMPRPDAATIAAFAGALETQLDRANPPGPFKDAPLFQRLNRTEYANAVRDLLAIDVDVRSLLPGDDSSEGFDNIAEALTVSPSLVQGYVAAALKISRRAIGDRTVAPVQVTYSAPGQWVHDKHVEGLPLGTRGGFLVSHTFPLEAEYELSIGGGGGGGGLANSALDVTLDGEPLKIANPRSFRQKIGAGPHTIGLALVDRQRAAGVDDTFSDHRADAAFNTPGAVQTLTITGPFDATGIGDTPSRKRILVCRPVSAAEEPACARRILSGLARRAYRRPPTAAEVDTLLTFYRQGRAEGDFEVGLQHALARVLVAPAFLLRTEEPPAGAAAGTVYALSDLALASRLSFFLWSSIPDDELLDLAVAGRLKNPAVLEKQVRRMLADPKAEALARNFAGQWLFLRDLDTLQTEARHFDDNLRQSFKRETEMLFGTIVREDRSLVELLDADYTFVDERLARHYGIPNVYGSYFRRVPLPADSPRRGILGQGSMQTVTSVATRTSPVMRGKWVLENLLGAPPPEPPPGVEVNLDPTPGAAPTTLRQRLEQHRANPVCASCHKVMDPIGFALENFDLVGAWRDTDGPGPIDASGQLADGTALKGPADLRKAVLSRSDAFLTLATEKLLTYAMGRPIVDTDMSSVREVVRKLNQGGNRFSALVVAVTQSAPFRLRVKRA